jgi:predicted amidophosphoribosyltransferase
VGDAIDKLLEEAPGFGRCLRCPYMQGGTVELCSRCARRTMLPLVPLEERCHVCDQPLEGDPPTCWNSVCRLSEEDRGFAWNFAIAYRTKWLKTAITDYKYQNRRAWAAIFGRILVGFLDEQAETFRERLKVDLIVGSPAYTGPGADRSWDHVREILVAADREQPWPDWLIDKWPFDLGDPPAIVKTAKTASMVGLGAQARRRNAETELRQALYVPDPARIAGKVIVIFDDVFTGGWTQRETARALREQGGAAQVYGVTLARQPSADS